MWLNKKKLNEILVWANPLESGIAFGSVLVLLLAVRYVSFISALSNLSLALLTATMAFRIYRNVLAAINKTNDGHPFQIHLEMDITLPEDQVRDCAIWMLGYVNEALLSIKSVFLLQDYFAVSKFAATMYSMTFLGRWLNGLSVVILFWIILFTWPKFYKDNKITLDEAFAPLRIKLDEMGDKLREIFPDKSKKEK